MVFTLELQVQTRIEDKDNAQQRNVQLSGNTNKNAR